MKKSFVIFSFGIKRREMKKKLIFHIKYSIELAENFKAFNRVLERLRKRFSM